MQNNSIPFFSIIIPCYNQAHFLSDCLESLFCQEYKNWEAIIVNDGSTDNTKQTVIEFSKIDSRIKLVDKENGGLSSARNKGIQEANGDYFIFLDADDLLLNNCLKKYAEILQEKIEFIQSGYLCFVDNINNVFYKRKKIKSYDDFNQTILYANIGPVNGFVVSKKLIEKVGLFNEELTSCEDWDYWIRCSKAGFSPHIVNEVFAAYRYVPGSMGKHSLRMLEQGLRVVNIHHLNTDTTKIDFQNLKNNILYKNASIRHLVFTTGIALFNNQLDSLEKIKKDYFEKISINIENHVFNNFSNYQTYRDFNLKKYLFFYIKKHKIYKDFFNYLFIINSIDRDGYAYFNKNILPHPLRLLTNRVFKKIKKSISF